jgi:hypothetical protein
MPLKTDIRRAGHIEAHLFELGNRCIRLLSYRLNEGCGEHREIDGLAKSKISYTTACAFRFLRQPSRPVSRRLDYGLRRERTFAAKSIDAIKNPMAM